MALYTDINTQYLVNSSPVLVNDMAAIQNKLSNLLRCSKRSRFRRPTFGVRLWELIHEPCDVQTANIILQDFYDAIAEWMGEIELDYSACKVLTLPEKNGYSCFLSYYVPHLDTAGSLSFRAWR